MKFKPKKFSNKKSYGFKDYCKALDDRLEVIRLDNEECKEVYEKYFRENSNSSFSGYTLNEINWERDIRGKWKIKLF